MADSAARDDEPSDVHAILIVNPAAGGETAVDHLPMMRERLGAAMTRLDVVVTQGEGDATAAGRHAVRDGCERVFVAGGDGTLNEVLNGIAEVDGGLARVTLGVIPLGTGNDFASALGVADEPEAAIVQLLAGRPHAVDVGRVNGRCFLNISAGGFIAEVSEAVPSKLKTVLGKLAYLVGGARVLAEYDPVRVEITATGEGPAPVMPHPLLYAFAVCNSRLIGGGRVIAPHAIVDDGWLDVCLIGAMPTLEFVALLRRVASGDHVDDARVSYFRSRELELTFGRPLAINTDGQVLEAERCRYEVLPGAVRVLLPPVVPSGA